MTIGAAGASCEESSVLAGNGMECRLVTIGDDRVIGNNAISSKSLRLSRSR
jgi:hypothetical protein